MRIWYHGTSKKAWKKIKATKYLKPFVADDYFCGAAVWFTSRIEQAKEFGEVVLGIAHKDAMKFKHIRISPIPRGMKKNWSKEWKKKYKDHFNFVVQAQIPIKYVKLVLK